MRRFKGFTLAELMVALAVIGILVAVVTPAIMKTRPNKNKMMIKKTFYIIEQAVNSLINDENLYPDMRDACIPGEGGAISDNCAYGFDYTDEVRSDGATYSGRYKFAALFKDKLNIKSDDASSSVASAGPDGDTFYPIFYTTDGVKWDFTGTNNAWTKAKSKVGKFTQCATSDSSSAGCGTIAIDVNGDEGPNIECTSDNDCDRYSVQILANGKLRINPTHAKAVDYATINTSIKDTIE